MRMEELQKETVRSEDSLGSTSYYFRMRWFGLDVFFGLHLFHEFLKVRIGQFVECSFLLEDEAGRTVIQATVFVSKD